MISSSPLSHKIVTGVIIYIAVLWVYLRLFGCRFPDRRHYWGPQERFDKWKREQK